MARETIWTYNYSKRCFEKTDKRRIGEITSCGRMVRVYSRLNKQGDREYRDCGNTKRECWFRATDGIRGNIANMEEHVKELKRQMIETYGECPDDE